MFFAGLVSALLAIPFATAQLSELEKHVDTLDLGGSFNYVMPAYWTSLPRHRRTPFAVSADGSTAFLAYLDASGTDVHVLEVDPTTFAAKGTPTTVSGGKEAGGLVAHNDGFALLTNIAVTGTSAPPSGTPVPVMVRYTSGKETWRTFLGGPGVHEADGLSMSPDMNGDLVFSEKAGLYGAYFVVTDYEGWAEGHFGDSIQYVDTTGKLQTISGASSAWGCSHNTGIAFEAADAAPFASICAEDHGSIWLNTKTLGMSNDGVKISGENVTNGASGEPMGGMSGSYSSLASFPDTTKYIFAWRTRGCKDLTADSWMGNGYTQCSQRTSNGNVAIAVLSDKFTMVGEQAISTVGAADGDSQLNLLTTGTTDDRSNVHAATFSSTNALVTWEEISSPRCTDIAFGCSGTFSGSYFQLVDSTGKKVGEPVSSTDTYVAGDIVNIGNKLCWPYVNAAWSLSSAVGYGSSGPSASKISFACISAGGSSGTTPPASSSAPAPAPTTSVAVTSAAATPAPTSASAPAQPITSQIGAASSVVSAPPSSAAAPAPSATVSSAPIFFTHTFPTTFGTVTRRPTTSSSSTVVVVAPTSTTSEVVAEPAPTEVVVGDDECEA